MAGDNPVWDEEEHTLRVMEEKCSTCILGPNSILLAEDTRNLVGKAKTDAFGNVVCHKTIKLFIGDGPGAICRGYWEHHGKHTIWGRLAVIEKVIKWWNPKRDTPERQTKTP